MSNSVWPADTNRRIPTGSRHLSKLDLFAATINTESSFKTCWNNNCKIHNYIPLQLQLLWGIYLNRAENTFSAIISRRSWSVIGEPAGFFNLRKTIGDKIWLAISSPGTSDNSANQMQIKGYDEAVIKRLRKYATHCHEISISQCTPRYYRTTIMLNILYFH